MRVVSCDDGFCECYHLMTDSASSVICGGTLRVVLFDDGFCEWCHLWRDSASGII